MQIWFQKFAFFSLKSPSVTQRSISQENAFEKSKKSIDLSCNTIGLHNPFILIENNVQVFNIAKFEFKVIVEPMGKNTYLWLHNIYALKFGFR